jgi:hypothetical protein
LSLLIVKSITLKNKVLVLKIWHLQVIPGIDINKLNLFNYGKNVLQGESNKIIIIFENVILVYLRLYNFRIILNRST